MGKQSRRQRSGWNKDKSSSSNFSAPTSGLEKVFFTHGSSTDAAHYEEVKGKIARYVCTQSWKGAAMAGKAIEDMIEPILAKPERPKKTDDDGVRKDEVEYEMDVEEWKADFKEYRLLSSS